MCLHLGQRKLLLTEVDFLTEYCDLSKNIVYVGAAPGHHIEFLSSLFPNNIFYLYDPREFAITDNENIKIYQKYFTVEDVNKLDDFIFISDIRQNICVKTMPQREICNKVMEDMEFQKSWVLEINPKISLLKFRLPLFCETFEYFDGKIVEQPWAPESTYETRLIVQEKHKIKSYITSDYVNLISQLKLKRQTQLYDHGLKLKIVPGLDNCFDCNLEIKIWKKYLYKFDEITNKNISNLMKRTGNRLKKYLTGNNHGKLRIV